MLKSFDIDLAGDFLVMAATLMHIKSAMLLPKADSDQIDAEDFEDPRTELIRQLLEYKKFKDAANLLDAAAQKQNQRFGRSDNIIERLKPDAEPQIDIDQVSVWDLLEAFDAILKATGSYGDISHITDDTPIDLYQIEILHRLQSDGPMSFETLFESRSGRLMMIGLFLALLELIREKLIWVEQSEPGGSIFLKALTDEPAEMAVQKAIVSISQQTQAQESATSPHKPGIAITEMPPKSQTELPTDIPEQQAGKTPIVEIPPEKNKSTAESHPYEQAKPD
jgi:segregation and condensation protein A